MLLKKDDAARLLGVSTRTLEKLTAEGKIAKYKIGGSVRYDSRDLDEFIEDCRIRVRPPVDLRRKAAPPKNSESTGYYPGMKFLQL